MNRIHWVKRERECKTEEREYRKSPWPLDPMNRKNKMSEIKPNEQGEAGAQCKPGVERTLITGLCRPWSGTGSLRLSPWGSIRFRSEKITLAVSGERVSDQESGCVQTSYFIFILIARIWNTRPSISKVLSLCGLPTPIPFSQPWEVSRLSVLGFWWMALSQQPPFQTLIAALTPIYILMGGTGLLHICIYLNLYFITSHMVVYTCTKGKKENQNGWSAFLRGGRKDLASLDP